MDIDQNILNKALVGGNYINEKEYAESVANAQKNNVSLVDYLLQQGLINQEILGQAIAESIGTQYVDPEKSGFDESSEPILDEQTARKYRVIAIKINEEGVHVISDNPGNEELHKALGDAFPDNPILLSYSLPHQVDNCFKVYRKTLDTEFSKTIQEDQRVAPELLNDIFSDAFIHKASDIHFEPEANQVCIRFRVDGVLHDAGRLPIEQYENILNRIKVQSGLRIDEHSSTQDGSMQSEYEGRKFDIRVSIAPTVSGEKVAMRILTSYITALSLAELGLDQKNQNLIVNAAKNPSGMILVVGPTGSGKTTTLYAVLKQINSREINITTIEDPVEYKIKGINQIQVNERANLTFSNGLRSVVRQDPDLILVGEIRDEETANIAINAALTGHILLSTFHANDAATAIPRLIDSGVEPFLISSTLRIVISQRLVRKICQTCRVSSSEKPTVDPTLRPMLKKYFKDTTSFYVAKGCNICNHTGYDGRTAIFEVLPITTKIQELIVSSPSRQQIWELAEAEGALSLFQDGVNKVKQGLTTISELMRVAEDRG